MVVAMDHLAASACSTRMARSRSACVCAIIAIIAVVFAPTIYLSELRTITQWIALRKVAPMGLHAHTMENRTDARNSRGMMYVLFARATRARQDAVAVVKMNLPSWVPLPSTVSQTLSYQ